MASKRKADDILSWFEWDFIHNMSYKFARLNTWHPAINDLANPVQAVNNQNMDQNINQNMDQNINQNMDQNMDQNMAVDWEVYWVHGIYGACFI